MPEDLNMLLVGMEGHKHMKRMIEWVGDVLLSAEVRCFQAVPTEAERVSSSIQDSEKIWGELATAKWGCFQHLKMADALTQIKDQDDGLLDDALWMIREFPDHIKHHGHCT